MPATVQIRRWTGTAGSEVKTDITSANTRANAADAHSATDTTNSILIPASGTNYSFWVVTRLFVSALPSGSVSNIKWYSDGALNFGTNIGCIGNTATAYTQATGTVATTGIVLNTTNYPTVTAPVSVDTFTSASPKSVAGSTSTASTDAGDFFVYQITVPSTVTQSGATPTETFTWQYDDTSS